MATSTNFQAESQTKSQGGFEEHAAKAAEEAKEAGVALANKAREKASAAATAIKEGAGNVASAVAETADEAACATGRGIESLAEGIRENTPREGILGAASDQLADTLHTGGKYLEEHGVTGMVDDLTEVIRRNPIPAVMVGVGIGFVLARVTSRT